ncbi:4'-phosphopantetheinyl transferase superfamily protein [Streptomyces sp. 7R007]
MWFSTRPLLGPAGGGRLAFVFPGLDADFEPRVDDVAAWLGAAPVAADAGTAVTHGLSVLGVGRLLDRALRRAGVRPDAVAGCSVGEWAAMMSSGHLTAGAEEVFDGVDPASVAVPDLMFAAVGLPAERVLDGVDARRGIVVSHDNAPARCVVCGPAAEVGDLVEELRGRGVLARELSFRSGFHTPMFAPYVEPFRRFAEALRTGEPTVPLWSGTTTARFTGRGPAVRELFLRMLVEPVRQRGLIEAMYTAGHRAFVQVSLGQLSAAVTETLSARPHLALPAATPHRTGMAQLRRVTAALWAEGCRVTVPEGAVPPPAEPTRRAGDSAVHPQDAPSHPPESAPPRRDPLVRLDLGGALMSLGVSDRAALRAALDDAVGARTEGAVAAGAPVPPGPVGAELRALFREMTQTSDLALTALAGVTARGTPPAPARPWTAPDAAGAPTQTGPVPDVVTSRTHRAVLRVSTEAMPHLRDHCFFRQRDGWPDESDRRPVMPGTTIVQHMTEIAEAAAPGRRVVEVSELRLLRWLAAAPPVDVTVTAEPLPSDPDRLRLDFGGYSTAVATTAPRFPSHRPGQWDWDAATESAPPDTAEEMYDGRLMFHGPAFQGVTELTAMGPRHVRGVITAPSAPGALLDCAGQILGYWIIRSFDTRTRVLPVGLDRVRFHGPRPVPGTRIGCHVRITRVDDTTVDADIQLTEDGGRVWAELSGWRNRRFDNHPETQAVENFPEYRALSRRQPGGWVLLFERWADLASRDLVMRNHLNAAERAEYESCPPPRRRHWLLGRIAAKDAVRYRLWEGGEETVFPAEIRVGNAPDGRPWVAGEHGRELPALDVSIAHCAQAAVALVRPRSASGAGIDIEEVTDRPPTLSAAALTDGERRLLAAHRNRTGESGELWFTRFWAAKEAAAKAAGTGLQGRPRRFEVCEVEEMTDGDGDLLATVRSGGERTYRIGLAVVRAPADLDRREYVVAWTR